jgi:hypothetical protein
MSFSSSYSQISRFFGDILPELMLEVASVDPLAGVPPCFSLNFSLIAALV